MSPPGKLFDGMDSSLKLVTTALQSGRARTPTFFRCLRNLVEFDRRSRAERALIRKANSAVCGPRS